MNILGLLLIGMLSLRLIGHYLEGDRFLDWLFVLWFVVVPFNDTLILPKKKEKKKKETILNVYASAKM